MSDKPTKEELKMASDIFCRVWEINRDKIEGKEKEFGRKLTTIITELFEPWNEYADDISPAYDFQGRFGSLKDLVEAYQDVFHIVSTTIGWREE